MNALEEYLIKKGLLEKFLNNLDCTRKRVYLSNAFTWGDTEEGYNFWKGILLDTSNNLYITQNRIKELMIERIPRFRKEQNVKKYKSKYCIF